MVGLHAAWHVLHESLYYIIVNPLKGKSMYGSRTMHIVTRNYYNGYFVFGSTHCEKYKYNSQIDWTKMAHFTNKLSLNVNKAKFMFFHSDRRRVVYPILSVNNNIIQRVDTFNFLGLHISQELLWKSHF